jgi:hypothetical protein
MTVANYSSKETLVELENLETLPLETTAQVSSVAQNSSQTLPEIISSTSSSISMAKSIKLGGDCNANYVSKPTSCSLFDENNNFKLSVLIVGKVTLESKNDQYQIVENVYSSSSKKTRIVYKYYFATNKIFKIFHESSIPEYCKQYCTLIK